MSTAWPTSSTGLDANEDRPIAVPAAAAARATATSPSGCTACTPVGDSSTGRLTGWAITVVASSRATGRSATCGRNRSSPNAATLSSMVRPASAPATRARYTDRGSRRLARRWASATVSNHCLVLAIQSTPSDNLSANAVARPRIAASSSTVRSPSSVCSHCS